MNRQNSTYRQTTWRATRSGTFAGLDFTGKERDEETGYGYFGARYYDSEALTGWLSVDPMADKYPGISPYAYCAWTPVKLVDPDGEEMGIPPGLARFGRGLAQTAGGVLTIGGEFVIGVGASETILGTMMGIGLISDGKYATTQGFHQMANVIAGRPESEDPKYSTVAGEVSNNKLQTYLRVLFAEAAFFSLGWG